MQRQVYFKEIRRYRCFFKKSIAKHIIEIQSNSEYILWLKLSGTMFSKDDDIILGTVYLPPERSNYFEETELNALKDEIETKCQSSQFVILAGDWNGRTGKLQDFIENDDFLLRELSINGFENSNTEKLAVFEELKISLKRASMDSRTNAHGLILQDTCRNNDLFMLNGRLGNDRDVGKLTFRDTSLIDYTIASANCFKLINSFSAEKTDRLFSDGHSFLKWSLKPFENPFQTTSNDKSKNPTSHSNQTKWDKRKASEYNTNIDINQLNQITNSLQNLEASPETIVKLTNDINTLMNDAAIKTFPTKKQKTVNTKNHWLDRHANGIEKSMTLTEENTKLTKASETKII